MGTERSLATLLRSLQTVSPGQDAFGILPSAAGLLSLLANPLNVTLLSSQLLCSPALWTSNSDLQTCRRILSVFNTAAISIVQNESAAHAALQSAPGTPRGVSLPVQRRGLERVDWIRAVVAGADDKSPRWRHALLLGGVLMGMEARDRASLSRAVRKRLEGGLVQAVGLAIEDIQHGRTGATSGIAGECLVLVLNYAFPLLADYERSLLDYDALLPLILDAAFASRDGLEAGYFLGTIDRDVREIAGTANGSGKLSWPVGCPTEAGVRTILAKPLVSTLGPLSRLLGHAVENCTRPQSVTAAVDALLEFCKTLLVQWRQNRISGVDAAEEAEFLDVDTMTNTLPTLWRLLKTAFFSTVIVLRSVLGRVLNDRFLASDNVAPYLAANALLMLRSLSFISTRIGQNASSHYIFVNLTAIDILSQYPQHSQKLLTTIRPATPGLVPQHPLDRTLDLFFLNTAEHFPLVLEPDVNEALLIGAALPYLAAGGSNELLDIFEAAHSVVLAVLAAPRSADMAAKHLEFYVATLFNVFPHNLSARQFRLAYRTILQLTAPPSPLANTQPLLPCILLDLLYTHAQQASPKPLPTTPINPPRRHTGNTANLTPNAVATPSESNDDDPTANLSEQAILTLTLSDTLPTLSLSHLVEWLPLVAGLIASISDRGMRRACQARFWDVLCGGELDVERAYSCVVWWGTGGGREAVLFGNEEDVRLEEGEAEAGAEGVVSSVEGDGGGGQGKEREGKGNVNEDGKSEEHTMSGGLVDGRGVRSKL